MQSLLALKRVEIEALVREIDDLHVAMEYRSVIEQAKRVIMRTMQCGPDAAFAVLVAQSQAENHRVPEFATALAEAQRRTPPESWS